MANSEAVSKKASENNMLEENFAELLNEYPVDVLPGTVVSGTVRNIENDIVIVDVGLKSEGKIPMKEFMVHGSDNKDNVVQIGEQVDVYVERIENKDGELVLSREKAKREEAWRRMEVAHEKGERVEGVIFGRVKGGFTVDLGGVPSFLPGSQVDIRPFKDISPLMNIKQPFQILKMDRQRGNIVVSRRAILEETREEAKSELVAKLEEGKVLKGVVKNITDYGAFIDLGGVDGLLHVTDISWKRIQHPSEVLSVGDTIDVKIIRFNKDTKRISLGIKQLQDDPWKDIVERFAVGHKIAGVVTNVTDYGAFVELDEGIEGLIHVSEMSWVKKNVVPSKILNVGEKVEIVVLEVDREKRRISLGLKQTQENPWGIFANENPLGTVLEGPVKNITEFGLFIGLTDELDGMIHLSDISWTEPGEKALSNFKKGDMVQAKIIEIDVEKERICLGVKQLTDDPIQDDLSKVKKGEIVTCTITEVLANGLSVKIGDHLVGFIKKGDLSRERADQRPERFAVDEKVDAKVTQIEKNSNKLTLSIKAREVDEEKAAMKQYGSSDSGASLGDILGAALEGSQISTTEETVEEKPAKKKAATKKKEETSEDVAEDAKEEKKTKKASTTKKAAKKDEAADEEKATKAKASKAKSTTKAKKDTEEKEDKK